MVTITQISLWYNFVDKQLLFGTCSCLVDKPRPSPSASIASIASMHEVFEAFETEEVHMVPVTDLIEAGLIEVDALTGCTVAKLMDSMPPVGGVLLGGNCLGPGHGHLTTASLTCIIGASYVAKCCFVSLSDDKLSKLILLPHRATIIDLKSELMVCGSELHGLTTCALHEIVCRDVEGYILDDAAELPKANANACADKGCHATFFIDIKPLSMHTTHVKGHIMASPLAIDKFCVGPNDFFHVNAAASFADVRKELATRLTDASATKPLVEDMLATELMDIKEAFRVLQDDPDCRSDLPRDVHNYVEQLIKDIGEERFDALDPAFPETIAQYLVELHEVVKGLVYLQTDALWVNYKTKTLLSTSNKPISVEDITKQLQKIQGSLFLHEQDSTFQSPIDRDQDMKDVTRGSLMSFAGYLEYPGHFEALLKIFERAYTIYNQELIPEETRFKDIFDTSLIRVNQEDVDFATTLKDEQEYTDLLEGVTEEHKALHEMALEQITWCTNFVTSSNSESQRKIDGFNIEIARLQTLKNKEEACQVRLAKFKKHLEDVKTTENNDARLFNQRLQCASRGAKQRLVKATKGVEQSKKFVGDLGTLYSKTKLELKDATEYYNLLLKKLGVDCHDTFMNTGKLFTIQGKLAEARKEKTERVAMVKHMEMQRAGSEVVEGDTHATNDYRTAQCNFDIAKKANASAVERVFTIKNVLVKLKADVNVVFAFLLSTSATLPPAPITVNNLPDLAEPAKFGKVQSVSEFRVYRSRTILPISHTLQQLQDYEEHFDQEFAQNDGNLHAQAAQGTTMVGN